LDLNVWLFIVKDVWPAKHGVCRTRCQPAAIELWRPKGNYWRLLWALEGICYRGKNILNSMETVYSGSSAGLLTDRQTDRQWD